MIYSRHTNSVSFFMGVRFGKKNHSCGQLFSITWLAEWCPSKPHLPSVTDTFSCIFFELQCLFEDKVIEMHDFGK